MELTKFDDDSIDWKETGYAITPWAALIYPLWPAHLRTKTDEKRIWIATPNVERNKTMWSLKDIINEADWDNRISSMSRKFFFQYYPVQVPVNKPTVFMCLAAGHCHALACFPPIG